MPPTPPASSASDPPAHPRRAAVSAGQRQRDLRRAGHAGRCERHRGQPAHAQRVPGGAARSRRSPTPPRPTADAPRASSSRCWESRSPSRTTSTSPGCRRGSAPRAECAPATADAEVVRRLRAAGAVIVGKTNTCELGQWPFTSGPGLRPHPQSVVARAHPGRLVGRQRRRGGRRAGHRGDRLRRRGQRPHPGGVDPPGRHQAAARPDLDLAAARGVQRHHRQRRAGPHRHRRRAGARRRVGQRRRRSAQAAAGAGVRSTSAGRPAR